MEETNTTSQGDVKKIKIHILDKDTFVKFIKRHWVVLALIFIIILGIQVRMIDYRWPYLRNIDSYDFARLIDQTVQNNGVYPNFDMLKLAPDGIKTSPTNFYIYVGAYSYMFFHMLMSGLQLFQFLLWFPAVLAALMAIPMYFIGKALYDKRAGIIAALFIVFDTSIMTRTLGGDPDSDAIVMLMPLIVMALFLVTYKMTEKKGSIKKIVLMSVITGISLILWQLTWGGYWFVISLITFFVLLKLLADLIRIKNIKRLIIEKKLLIILYLIVILIFIGYNVAQTHDLNIVFVSITGPLGFQEIKAETGTFPNVYVSVAELQNPSDARDIINRTGMPFFIMVFSLIYLIYSYIKKRQHLDTLILLAIWFVGPFLATLVAIRFTTLFSAPIAIGSGIFFTKLIRLVTGEDKSLED
jgi:asparagine N-glycosylation enzyme membrane subunit Stt3